MQAARGAAVGVRPGAPPRRRTALLLTVAGLVLAADVASKIAVVHLVRPGEQVHIVPGVLRVTLTRNAGAAFSLGTGATVLFSAVAVAVVAVIVRQARRLVSSGWATCLGLLLGGALGNLGDRLFRAPAPLRGQVVDWIQLPHWPVFNIADSAIVVGGLLAVLLSMRGIPLDGKPVAASAGSDSAEAP